jgi:hypothetical protein
MHDARKMAKKVHCRRVMLLLMGRLILARRHADQRVLRRGAERWKPAPGCA